MTKLKTSGITVVDGVEVDIEVRGDEDKAEKTLMDLKARLSELGAAFEYEKPPSEFDEIPTEYRAPMSVAWDRVFEVEE